GRARARARTSGGLLRRRDGSRGRFYCRLAEGSNANLLRYRSLTCTASLGGLGVAAVELHHVLSGAVAAGAREHKITVGSNIGRWHPQLRTAPGAGYRPQRHGDNPRLAADDFYVRRLTEGTLFWAE